MRLRAANWRRWRPDLRRGKKFARASTNWSAENRTGCGWWISGFFRSVRSRKRRLQSGEDERLETRKACAGERRKNLQRGDECV